MTKKNCVLIVDDDNTNLMVLSEILGKEYKIRVASEGTGAIKIAQEHLPDLILLDIVLPGMNGYEVFGELKKTEETEQIPVIFITGLNNRNDEKRGLELGAADYISKPFDDMIVKLRVRHQIRIINQLRTIEHLSLMDQLTGIANRRNFDSRLRVEWGRAIREKSEISLLLIDIDRFKNYNDTYGHQQGDRALRMVSNVLSKALKRSSDFCARWGGEEFVVLLPNTDIPGGMAIGEQIRENMEASEVACEDGSITKLTVSAGLNTCTPTAESSVDEFISRADKALYAAKNSGRNKICSYI